MTAVAWASLVAATLIGCGGQVAATGDARATSGACSQIHEVTALLSSPLPTNDVFDGATSDGQYVYFEGSAGVYRVPVSGGPLEAVYAGPLPPGRGVSVFGAAAGTIAWLYAATPYTQAGSGITVENASGLHEVALPGGATPLAPILVDVDGDVFFNVLFGSASARAFQTWRWNPVTGSAAQMPGVGESDGSAVNLYWVDRGQIIWASPHGGVYTTDISTGAMHELNVSNGGFGSLVGLDATNLYGTDFLCPDTACAFSVCGTPRDGGTPFDAFGTPDSYWTPSLQVDDTGVYWIDWSTPGIYHAPLAISSPGTLLAAFGSGILPSRFAMDACNVYWIDANGAGATQQVMAVPR